MEEFRLKGFSSFSDIENQMMKLHCEGRKIVQISVSKENFEKLKQIIWDNFRVDFSKELTLNTIFGKLKVEIND